ncbi:MAG: hypothetical protein JOZ69_14550, partial [Myxococcales bacterium]|nr:hypothetical protein [Myxococcales bacterium]
MFVEFTALGAGARVAPEALAGATAESGAGAGLCIDPIAARPSSAVSAGAKELAGGGSGAGAATPGGGGTALRDRSLVVAVVVSVAGAPADVERLRAPARIPRRSKTSPAPEPTSVTRVRAFRRGASGAAAFARRTSPAPRGWNVPGR